MVIDVPFEIQKKGESSESFVSIYEKENLSIQTIAFFIQEQTTKVTERVR